MNNNPELKGVYGGNCNRTACQKPNANYYNHSTQLYYCEECAILINDANAADAQRLYGHPLCTLGEHKTEVEQQAMVSVPLVVEIEDTGSVGYNSNTGELTFEKGFEPTVSSTSLENKKVPVKATVKGKWIYAGLTLDVISFVEATESDLEIGVGSKYKLSLIGTEFENRYKNAPYTFIHDNDLDIIYGEPKSTSTNNLLESAINNWENNGLEYKRDASSASYITGCEFGASWKEKELLPVIKEHEEEISRLMAECKAHEKRRDEDKAIIEELIEKCDELMRFKCSFVPLMEDNLQYPDNFAKAVSEMDISLEKAKQYIQS